ncbi:MAG: hypothetical protein WB586_19450 [Chthoniobacterales bacterium]
MKPPKKLRMVVLVARTFRCGPDLNGGPNNGQQSVPMAGVSANERRGKTSCTIYLVQDTTVAGLQGELAT